MNDVDNQPIEDLANETDNSLRPHVIIEYQLQPPTRDEGGFINKKTGIHYINVAVQTDPKPKPPAPKKYTRDAQTVQMTDHVSQTYRESGTQMVFILHIIYCIFFFSNNN